MQNTSSAGVLTTQEEKFTGSYLEWIKDELTGWEPFAWGLYGFGMGLNTMSFVTAPITWLSTIAFIAIGFGFLCTISMAAKGWKKFQSQDGVFREKLVVGRSINGLAGAVSVVGYIIVNIYAGHWWSVLDQLIFFFAIDLGLIINWRTWGRGKNSIVKTPTVKNWILIVLTILISWAVLYPVGVYLNDSQPLIDALVLAIGGVASVLYVKRYSGTYVLWIASNLINVVLWFGALDKGITPVALSMLVMTALYMVSSIYGKINFRSANSGKIRDIVLNND